LPTVNDGDLCVVGFRVIPVHPVVAWNAPILTLNKEKMVLVYEDVAIADPEGL